MRLPRSAFLALLCLAVIPAAAQAASITITPPSSPPNYWAGFTATVSGVADAPANLFVSARRSVSGSPFQDVSCPALYSDLNVTGFGYGANGGAPVEPGSFSLTSTIGAPKADRFEQAGI